MSQKEDMHNVLNLQKMKNTQRNALTSNLSVICKEESTISLFACLPDDWN
ncbi:class III lanthipeptide [Gracilibacillus caseinilyticus]|uniref:Class III lanthipeptide n=1 Tax=Gracilibacillus caseinilyticus TaxID=2932256 RepID=A0ABY4EZC5_9BACI|nr:class III lanthipeptide [Gracilibacillus caseinilyticus]UOQ49762.1 class III lanthipeptide [Gracilibacillus caseinilyticus]